MYIIKKINDESVNVWDNIESIWVDNFPWDKVGYTPNTEVKLYYTDEYIKIRFTSEEKKVKVEYSKLNQPVFKDSCVEFFFKPAPEKDNRYFNFEMNAAGTLLLQLDEDTRERELLNDIDLSIFEINTDVTSENKDQYDNFKPWNVEYKIPFSFIKKYFDDFEITSGHIIKGNLYKCGDDTEIPHFGCWNKIEYHKPSFHQPAFFTELRFE